ncbi:hypothetical protein A2154_01480 [Candidatus Gottesmanbacteria bacterium RBG_16_43_7]|uniref:Transcription regulator TrmB N-terminal domain-containing protein n=1 Tax=Candidatus Gottesmanbacteria bacterium RBG_16_43_7 TaxID=1798373 RepID=A0A1F5ZAV4_9BACT|nr:MAG: hypothetical protein A2154_01480 [Candidatus Gottesmanbacteria bacterium RBG_16_43_7]
MTKDILTSVGLTPEQADIYLSLLTHGAQSASGLSKTTKVQRTYVYKICQELITQGLVNQSAKSRGATYMPLSPDHLLAIAEENKTKAATAVRALEGVLPELKSKYSVVEEKPVITYFEGIEGIKKIYGDTIKESKPILALVETSKVDQRIYEWVTTVYVKKRIEHKIPVRAIVAKGPKTRIYIGKNEKELRDTKTVPSEKFPFEHEINIYGDKLALINHKAGAKLIGIIVHNKIIASTFRSWFELSWGLLS